MAFVSYSTETVNLTEANAIREGCDEFYVFTVETALGPANLAEFAAVGGEVRCDFRTTTKRSGGVTTNCPQPSMSFLNGGTGGQIQLHMPRAQTEDLSTLVLQGTYDIEIVHAATGYVTRPFSGSWAIDLQTTDQ